MMKQTEEHQIDHSPRKLAKETDNYTDASTKFVERLGVYSEKFPNHCTHTGKRKIFTED